MPTPTGPAPGSTDEAGLDDFSLVVGGPLYQLFRRASLSTEGLGLVGRRVVTVILIAWVPLVALSALQAGLIGPGHGTPFIKDIGYQLRFLIVMPLLIVAEVIVHRRMRPIVAQFRLRGLVRPDQEARFAAALDQAARWRNSAAAEIILLIVVYATGILFTLRRYLHMGATGWYALPSGGLSLAGYWLLFVSLPLLQFLLLRWYFRLFIWGQFIWRVSLLDLDLNATHPDKAAGLGFLGESLNAFVPIAAAHGVLFAGMIADRILFARAKLTDFQVEVFAGAVFLLLIFVGPLMVWIPKLARVKRSGLRTYGALGQSYVLGFRDKWLSGGSPDEPLLGSGDIQSLADLGNSYASADQMRLAPIQATSVAAFLVAFLAPIAPLLLTMMSAEKLIGRLVGIVF